MRPENDGGVSIAASAGERGAERDRSRDRSRLADVLAGAKAHDRSALMAYVPVGYPSVPGSIAAMVAAVEGGADAIEVGIPYSDPGIDGPVIQQAVDVAVRAGGGMRDVLQAVEAGAAPRARAGGGSAWEPI